MYWQSLLDVRASSRFARAMKNAAGWLLLGVLGCGGAAGAGGGATAGDANASARVREVNVFSSTGESKTCEPPEKECTAPKSDPDLRARCSLAGFRMVQCGCEMYCMGKPQAAEKMVYDANGNAKACAKPEEDCTPPPAGAAFQDACNDKGYRLETCGCEWLCSGNPAK